MRVLFWTPVFWPKIGGVEVHAMKLLCALAARGYEFLVLTTKSDPDQRDQEKFQGIPVYRLPFWNHTTYTEIEVLVRIRQKVADLKRDFAPDLVHINAVDAANFFHLLTAHIVRAPVLVTLHGEWPERQDGVVRQTLAGADWVAGCSRAILDKGRDLVPGILRRSCVIHNGLETPELLPTPLPFAAPRLLCLGRLSPEKGFDLAIEAFSRIAQEFPRARLAIAGDGIARAELEAQSAALGLLHRVEFLGWIDPKDIPALINSATMVLMPSRQESLPLVALEAALMARPLVATRVGGLPEVLAHGETGLLVNPEDAQSLADAVAFFLGCPERAMRMGRNARSRAQQRFSWDTHVDGYDALYRKLTRGQMPLGETQSEP
jgi:glycogen(starch) synthase